MFTRKVATSVILFGIANVVFASELTPVTGMSMLKEQIKLYHASGAYINDIKDISTQAQNYVKARVKKNLELKNPEKLAIILDIDETTLSNYENLKKLDFGGTPIMQRNAELKANDSAIKPAYELYRYAINNDVKVFFITGRDEGERESTRRNLVNAGYTSVKNAKDVCETAPVSEECNLYFREGKYLKPSAIIYKTAMRKRIAEAGYMIIANVGDQYSDLAGGYSELTYKYPNFMYYIP